MIFRTTGERFYFKFLLLNALVLSHALVMLIKFCL